MEGRNILLLSHGILSSTGFARVIHQIAMALRDEGNRIFVPNREYHGKPLILEKARSIHGDDFSGITILGFGSDRFGADIVPWYIDKYNIDIVITLGDIYAYQYLFMMPEDRTWRWIPYFALDTENMVDFWVNFIRNFDIPVVMSEFGQRLCSKYDLDVKHIPHAVDTKMFRPLKDEEEKQKIRKKLNLPQNAFIMLCVAHNQRRKMLDKLVDAFAMFAQGKDNVYLLFHSQPHGGSTDGWIMDKLLTNHGIMDKVMFTNYNSKGIGDGMVSDEMMRELYCACDAHVLLTGGEGFGIPFIESMACGLPNITSYYTTGPEIFGEDSKCAILIPPRAYHTHQTGGKWAMVDEELAAKAMETLYRDEKLRTKMGEHCRKRVVEKYDIKRIQEMWIDLVESVENKPHNPPDNFPFGCYTLPDLKKAVDNLRGDKKKK